MIMCNEKLTLFHMHYVDYIINCNLINRWFTILIIEIFRVDIILK